MTLPGVSPAQVAYLENLLAKTPTISTKVLPVVTQAAKAPLPPNLKIPLLVIGAAVVGGALLYSLTQNQQKAVQDKAVEKYKADNPNPGGGSKCFQITFFNLANVRGVGYECANTLEVIPSSSHGGKLALRKNGVDISGSTTCHELTIAEVTIDSTQPPPSTEFGNCNACWATPTTWDALTTQQKDLALSQLTTQDIEPIIKNAEPSRIVEGQTFDTPLVFTGDSLNDDPTKREPFTVDNPASVDSPTINLPSGIDLPDIITTPITVNTPIEGLDSPGQTITVPTSPSSGSTFSPRADGGVDLYQYGTPTAPATTPAIPDGTNNDVTNEDLHNQLREVLAKINYLPVAIGATIAPALTRIPSPEQLKSAVETGVCNTMKTGGCSDNAIKRNTNNTTQTLGNKIDAMNSAGQDAALLAIGSTVNTINTKIGPVTAIKSVGEAINNIMNHSGVGRMIDLITMVAVVHNALMLSNNIGTTLFSIIDNIIAVPTLIVNPKAETVNSQEVFGKKIEEFFIGLFGKATWLEIKTALKAGNNIISTSSQLLDNTRSLFSDTQDIANVASSWVAQLGNGMQNEGLIGEDNWEQKPEKPRFKSKTLGRLQNMAEGIEAIDNGLQAIEQVTANLKNIVETGNQIKENVTELDKQLDEGKKVAGKLYSDGVKAIEDKVDDFDVDDLY